MNEEEKYLFDLRGYLVVKNALTQEQVKDLSEIVDATVSYTHLTLPTKA